MYQTSYASLLADIIQFTEDQSIDLLVNLPGCVALAESNVIRDLDLELFQGVVPAGSTVAASPLVTRPAVIAQKSVWITVDSKKFLLEKRSYDFCQMLWPDSTQTITPVDGKAYYAEQDDGTWYLAPTPDAVYPVTAFGLSAEAGLSSDNQTTWISTYVGDLLLKAALIQCERFLKNADLVTVWQGDYADLLAKAQLTFRGAKRGDYSLSRQASNATAIL